MHRSLVLALALAGGCSNGTPGTTTPADMTMGPPPTDMTFTGCGGTFTPTGRAQFLAKFKACTIDVGVTPGDQSMVLKPGMLSSPSQPYMIELKVVAGPAFKVGHYDFKEFLPGTRMVLVTQDQMSRYIASKLNPDPANLEVESGSATLDVWSLPTVPQNAPESWIDTTMHGVLKASMAWDPATPGTPGDTLQLQVQF